MSLDPNLPALLRDAAQDVQGVLLSIRGATTSEAMTTVPGWQGSIARQHLMNLDQLRTRLNAAAAALGTLQAELQTGASLAGQALTAEADAAARAATTGQGSPVYGPPWPGY
jgi:uncharacterized protein YukE